MISFIKKGAFLLLAFFAFNTVQGQATKVMKVDSIVQLEPIIMFDYTDFVVSISVYDSVSFFPDSIAGDLFYYYLTDSMILAGTPPRVINDDSTTISINGFITDTVSIDILPDEIRTSPPVNLIILWPAMMNPELADSVCDSLQIGFDGYAGIPGIPDPNRHKIVFPVPAIQYIYIKPEEIDLIDRISILALDGKLISTYEPMEYKSGFINIDTMAVGTYLVELNYKNGNTIRTKIIKNQ